MFAGLKSRETSVDTASSTSRILTAHMQLILEKLKGNQNRSSTIKNYHQIWTQFNAFIIRLDYRPPTWEERASLYGAYLVESGRQSSTIKSYISAIKGVLKTDGYQWDDNKVLLNAITKACKIRNDQVTTRLPIQIGLLEILLFEIERVYNDPPQPYLEILFKTLFSFAYHGLFRVGELADSDHTIKSKRCSLSS